MKDFKNYFWLEREKSGLWESEDDGAFIVLVMAEDYLFCHKAFTHVEDNNVFSFVLSSPWFCFHSIRNKERGKT
jgi:hypothetical protein